MHLHAALFGAEIPEPTAGSIATNSTVTVREMSGFSVTIAASFSRFLSPKPVTEHSTSYSGTSANPKPNAPSARAPSCSASLRCPRSRPVMRVSRRASSRSRR